MPSSCKHKTVCSLHMMYLDSAKSDFFCFSMLYELCTFGFRNSGTDRWRTIPSEAVNCCNHGLNIKFPLASFSPNLYRFAISNLVSFNPCTKSGTDKHSVVARPLRSDLEAEHQNKLTEFKYVSLGREREKCFQSILTFVKIGFGQTMRHSCPGSAW